MGTYGISGLLEVSCTALGLFLSLFLPLLFSGSLYEEHISNHALGRST